MVAFLADESAIESVIFVRISFRNLICKLLTNLTKKNDNKTEFLFHYRKVYRKAISLRDENSTGPNGNVLLGDDSTDPLPMDSHTSLTAVEVKLTFKLYH